MSWFRHILVACIVTAPFAAPLTVRACPLCSEAIANANDSNAEDDVDQFPIVMNRSIYLMLGVPYTALCVVGFFIYRGMKQNDEYRKGLEGSPSPETNV